MIMALGAVDKLRAMSAFEAGVAAGRAATRARRFAQPGKRGGIKNAGFFYRRGYEMATSGLYGGRSPAQAFGLAMEDFEEHEAALMDRFEHVPSEEELAAGDAEESADDEGGGFGDDGDDDYEHTTAAGGSVESDELPDGFDQEEEYAADSELVVEVDDGTVDDGEFDDAEHDDADDEA